MAQQYIKQPETFDCEFCSNKLDLRKRRNCGWQDPGECNVCGDVPFEAAILAKDGSKFTCPTCGGKVRWNKSAELVLGKYRVPGCPKSMISEKAVFLIQLVDWSEKTGVLPTAMTLFDESMFYFEVRNFVISERNVAEYEMMPKEK